MDTRERLVGLMEMAREPGNRRALALELAALLLECPPDARETVAQVLEKIALRLDGETRAELASRLAGEACAPLSLLGDLFFDAGEEARKTIFARIAGDASHAEACAKAVDEAALLAAVRKYPRGTFVQVLSRMLGIPAPTAARIVVDPRGEGLAILCKGAELSRATYSTLTLLTEASAARAEQLLDAYDRVPNGTSAQLVAVWRRLGGSRINHAA